MSSNVLFFFKNRPWGKPTKNTSRCHSGFRLSEHCAESLCLINESCVSHSNVGRLIECHLGRLNYTQSHFQSLLMRLHSNPSLKVVTTCVCCASRPGLFACFQGSVGQYLQGLDCVSLIHGSVSGLICRQISAPKY